MAQQDCFLIADSGTRVPATRAHVQHSLVLRFIVTTQEEFSSLMQTPELLPEYPLPHCSNASVHLLVEALENLDEVAQRPLDDCLALARLDRSLDIPVLRERLDERMPALLLPCPDQAELVQHAIFAHDHCLPTLLSACHQALINQGKQLPPLHTLTRAHLLDLTGDLASEVWALKAQLQQADLREFVWEWAFKHLRAVFWDAWTRDMTDADQAHRLKAGMEARMADCKAKWPARLPPQPDWELWI